MNGVAKIIGHMIEREVILTILNKKNKFQKNIPMDYYSNTLQQELYRVIDIYGGNIHNRLDHVEYEINFNYENNNYDTTILTNRLNDLTERYDFSDLNEIFNAFEPINETKEENKLYREQVIDFDTKTSHSLEDVYHSIEALETSIDDRFSNYEEKLHNFESNIKNEINSGDISLDESSDREFIKQLVYEEISDYTESFVQNLNEHLEKQKEFNNKLLDMITSLSKEVDKYYSKRQIDNRFKKYYQQIYELLLEHSQSDNIDEYLKFFEPKNFNRTDFQKLVSDVLDNVVDLNKSTNKTKKEKNLNLKPSDDEIKSNSTKHKKLSEKKIEQSKEAVDEIQITHNQITNNEVKKDDNLDTKKQKKIYTLESNMEKNNSGKPIVTSRADKIVIDLTDANYPKVNRNINIKKLINNVNNKSVRIH